MDATLELPFDQFQRYRLVADLCAPLVAERPGLRALEVGGRTGLLGAFLPGAQVAAVDVEPSDLAGLILGDGSRLPFQDGSFDLVAACDTLEHVRPERRADFVRECWRVSRGWVVLAGPYDSPEVRGAEESLAAFLEAKLATRHRYLEEHRSLGLPCLEGTRALLADLAEEVVAVGHGHLGRWLPLLSLSMYLEHDPHLRGLARSVYRFYNRHLHAADDAPPVYRQALVARRAGSPRPATATPRAPRESRSQGPEPWQMLLGELVAFDRRSALYEAEAGELRATIGTLRADLEGHRGRLAETEALLGSERGARLAVERALGADLAGHRARLAETERLLEAERAGAAALARDLGADLAGHRSRLAETEGLLAAERAAAGRTEGLLRAELAAHQRRVAELERELEGPRAEVRALRQVADELARQLELRVLHQADLERRLAESEARVAELGEALRREHGENLELRAEMRSRARSLLRALAPWRPTG